MRTIPLKVPTLKDVRRLAGDALNAVGDGAKKAGTAIYEGHPLPSVKEVVNGADKAQHAVREKLADIIRPEEDK